jgi:hypothetical protein
MYRNNCILCRRENSVVIAASVTRFLWNALILAICHAAEDEGDSEPSEDSADNHSIDYDDIAGQDEWYADDPYMPSDDYIINEIMSASDDGWDEEDIVVEANVIYEEDISRNRMREVLTFFVAGSVPILGLAITAVISATFLYYVRIETLMRRYARDGVVMNGLILASYPDIYETTTVLEATETLDYMQTNNTYSMMSEDGSYQLAYQSDSGSDDSTTHETDEGKDSGSVIKNETSHPRTVTGSVQSLSAKSSTLPSRKKAKEKERRYSNAGDVSVAISSTIASTTNKSRRPNWNVRTFTSEREIDENAKVAPLENEVSVGDGTEGSTTQIGWNANPAPTERNLISFKKYIVLVEYDDVTLYDATNKAASRKIHKRLEVHGDDIQQTNASTSAFVKVHVLRDKPNSGYPTGEVFRSIRWQKKLSFIVHMMLGSSLVLCMGFAVKYTVSAKLFLLYVGMSLILLPFLNCFLQESFSEDISKAYLENGVSRPSEFNMKSVNKQLVVSALQKGTSFCYV